MLSSSQKKPLRVGLPTRYRIKTENDSKEIYQKTYLQICFFNLKMPFKVWRISYLNYRLTGVISWPPVCQLYFLVFDCFGLSMSNLEGPQQRQQAGWRALGTEWTASSWTSLHVGELKMITELTLLVDLRSNTGITSSDKVWTHSKRSSFK